MITRKEAEETIISDKCNDCKMFAYCDLANDFNDCDVFKEMVDELLEEEAEEDANFIMGNEYGYY